MIESESLALRRKRLGGLVVTPQSIVIEDFQRLIVYTSADFFSSELMLFHSPRRSKTLDSHMDGT